MDEIEHAGAINEEKTFKEDKCMICLDKEPNVLFCSCGHLCICEECRKILENKNMCVSCREISVNVRIRNKKLKIFFLLSRKNILFISYNAVMLRHL